MVNVEAKKAQNRTNMLISSPSRIRIHSSLDICAWLLTFSPPKFEWDRSEEYSKKVGVWIASPNTQSFWLKNALKHTFQKQNLEKQNSKPIKLSTLNDDKYVTDLCRERIPRKAPSTATLLKKLHEKPIRRRKNHIILHHFVNNAVATRPLAVILAQMVINYHIVALVQV